MHNQAISTFNKWRLYFVTVDAAVVLIAPFLSETSVALNTGKKTKTNKHGTAKGWPRPLNRGDRLIQ